MKQQNALHGLELCTAQRAAAGTIGNRGNGSSCLSPGLGSRVCCCLEGRPSSVLTLPMWKQVQRGQTTCSRPHSKRLTEQTHIQDNPSIPSSVSNTDEAWQEFVSPFTEIETEAQREGVMFWSLWTPKPVLSPTLPQPLYPPEYKSP